MRFLNKINAAHTVGDVDETRWGDAVFNGRAGRVFRGLRPAAGCSGAEMGWGQSFSGSFR